MHLPVLKDTAGNSSSPSSSLTLDLLLNFEMGTSQEGLNNHSSSRDHLVLDLNLPVAVDTESYSCSSYSSPALDLNLGV
ncbi:hypothetical protein AQUCO_07800021v1 [Aquilegia coerulea]|uniref:Uncharacterized protein n=1 Tax=Aquilegia coerulea TaxID=218851 RepID=A0A2G5C7Y7_AQUCA|nr:hypothetical protein AQUCO_07800021v1 [Aquilegia coerulea]